MIRIRIISIRISKQSKYRDKQAKGFSIKLYKKLCLVLNQFEIWYFKIKKGRDVKWCPVSRITTFRQDKGSFRNADP